MHIAEIIHFSSKLHQDVMQLEMQADSIPLQPEQVYEQRSHLQLMFQWKFTKIIIEEIL